MSRGKRTLFVTLLCATATCAAAEDEMFEDHHAHEHGVATLNVAVDASRLALQFRSPAMNLVGFEHRPRTAQDQAAVSQALEWLRDPAGQFQPSAEASCRVVKSEVTPPDWEDPSGHSEFAADYEFDCQKQAALQHLYVRLLEHLEAETKIEAQVAAPDGQHSTELTRANTRLVLRKPVR
ncbi:DUF2796 domain-containing protein [Steroidobacter sp. S1-65]|uniref:DUF2796 domain-containing protein n=1 Tax=Steroidobacter gossypii TaxID=2805490 RepID=A0ABS1WVE5_9GAMM|nr:DUF2796 domain-containing protein [Steroidobacter gossypii]MBM0104947.1 DUF2796 domain-containing protein [Steroidobacter gossypii]